MALIPGREITVGVAVRQAFSSLSSSRFLAVHKNATGAPGGSSTLVAALTVQPISTTYSGFEALIIAQTWRVLVITGATTLATIANPYTSEEIGHYSIQATSPGQGRSYLNWHYWSVAIKYSTLDTDFPIHFLPDGTLSVWLDGAEIYSGSGLTIGDLDFATLLPRETYILYLGLEACDMDAVYVRPGTTHPTSWDANGVPTDGAATLYDFEDLSLDGWTASNPPTVPYPYIDSVFGVSRSAGISEYITDPDEYPAQFVTGPFGKAMYRATAFPPLCVCPPRPEYGGGYGYTACCGPVVEGDNPLMARPIWVATCDGAGSVPTGTNGVDAESWLE